MNIINFNSEVLGGNFKNVRDGIIYESVPKDVLESPIFYFDDLPDEKLISKDSNDDILELVSSEPNLLPFRNLRLYLNANTEDRSRGLKGVKYWITHENGRLAFVFSALPQNEKVFFEICVEGGRVNCCPLSYIGPLEVRNQKMYSDRMMAFFTSLCWFIREVNSPANFIASVTPETRGKSVEWQKARTHFVVIHRSHPANRKDLAIGANISVGSSYETRQAHTRRAHSRILRSPRFRHKLGQTIRVRACWCGPKEWTQSKSIYRVRTNPREDAA